MLYNLLWSTPKFVSSKSIMLTGRQFNESDLLDTNFEVDHSKLENIIFGSTMKGIISSWNGSNL